jgi:hypothetical protein
MSESADLVVFQEEVPKGGIVWRGTGEEARLVPKESEPEIIAIYPAKKSPTLFREFALLFDDYTPEAILGFANRYGWLGLGEKIETPDGKEIPAEKLESWRHHIARLWSFIRAWDLASGRNLRAMKEHLEIVGGGKAERAQVTPDGGEVLGNLELPGPDAPDHASLLRARRHLKEIVVTAVTDELYKRVECRPIYYAGRVEFRIQPKDLLGCMWLQFGLSLENDTQARPCEVCGKSYIANARRGARKSRRYCSGTCKGAAYRNRQKEARRLHAAGESPDQIAELLSHDTRKVSEETVRKWIAAGKSGPS